MPNDISPTLQHYARVFDRCGWFEVDDVVKRWYRAGYVGFTRNALRACRDALREKLNEVGWPE